MNRTLALITAFAVVAACTEVEKEATRDGQAARIVSLAPNLTELLYTVGAGQQLVGVSAWSDYPREVLNLPVVGDAFTVDQEQLALTNPDLLLVWESGTPQVTVDELRRIGYNVAAIRTRGLDDIAVAMLQLGRLTDREETAAAAAERFRGEIRKLRESHRNAVRVRVFYQVSARPLYTVNREHYISDLIDLCGGENVFSDLSDLAPTVDVEAVVERNPEVMLASTAAGDQAFDEWLRWPEMAANRLGNHYLLPADEIGRPTTRVVVAGQAMCLALQRARAKRAG